MKKLILWIAILLTIPSCSMNEEDTPTTVKPEKNFQMNLHQNHPEVLNLEHLEVQGNPTKK